MFAGLVGCATRVRSLVLDGALVDPVEELAISLRRTPRSGRRRPTSPTSGGSRVLVSRPARRDFPREVALAADLKVVDIPRPPCRWTLPLRALVGVHPRTDPSNPGAGIGRGWIEAFRESAGYRSGWGDFLDCGGLHVALRRLSPPACWTDAARREPAAGSEGGDCDLASPACGCGQDPWAGTLVFETPTSAPEAP